MIDGAMVPHRGRAAERRRIIAFAKSKLACKQPGTHFFPWPSLTLICLMSSSSWQSTQSTSIVPPRPSGRSTTQSR